MTPATHAIVYTRHSDGGVSVCRPTLEAIKWMGSGGYWNEQPRGFLQELVRRKSCPILQKGKQISELSAWKFVKAMQWGGLTTNQAWDVIRLHDCDRFGFDAEVMRLDDLPARWFRDAWARGHNSGAVYVDMKQARKIQWDRALDAWQREGARRRQSRRRQPTFDRVGIRRAIANARDADELQRVMPTW